MSQILDLQDNGLDWLACHLGHDISVHREYYRLHESTIELAKVGKILTTVDERKTRLRAGKSLNDIDLDKDIDPISGRLKEFSSAGNLYSEGLLMKFVFCEEKIDSIDLNIVVISP